MPTTSELIQELRDKAQGASKAGIVVGFEQRTEYVWADAPDPLGDLNTLVKGGGKPLAVCRVDMVEGAITLQPLEECTNEGWVKRYLDRIGTLLANKLEEHTTARARDIQRIRPDLN